MTKVEISLKSVFNVVFILLALLLAWKINGIIVSLIISFIFMAGFAPLVDFLNQKTRLPKTISILITYILVIAFISLLLYAIIPPLVTQTQGFLEDLPFFVSRAVESLGISDQDQAFNYSQKVIETFGSSISGFFGNVIKFTVDIFSSILAFITISVFTFYLLLERDRIKGNLFYFFPHLPKQRVTNMAHKIELKLGAWVRGQLLLSLIIGLITFVSLSLLGVEFALPLAVIAGVLELVPIIGPIISALPAIIVALVQSPNLAIIIIITYLIIQQLENNLIVPKVMEKAVGLSPLVVILSLMIGGSLMGVLGALIAVPIAASIQVVLQDLHEHNSKS